MYSILLVSGNGGFGCELIRFLGSHHRVHRADEMEQACVRAMALMPDVVVLDGECGMAKALAACERIKANEATSHLMVAMAVPMEPDAQRRCFNARADLCMPVAVGDGQAFVQLQNLLRTRACAVVALGNRCKGRVLDFALPKKGEPLLKIVEEMVMSHIDNPLLSVNLIAKELGVSGNLLYRKVKEASGTSVVELISIIRVKAGARMVLQCNRSISEIAYMVGFSSPSYFARRFKGVYGCSPSEYVERTSA